MTRYASVRWYAYGSSDPANNLVNRLTKKGEKVAADTVTLVGANHFVHKEMMDDLYAELVEKRNRADGYDLIILEFDGDLLCREGFAPYQLNYRLPEGWTDEKAARLRAAMSRYYAEDRVVWIVPDVNQEKSDAGYTGEYPWTSNPEFIWQRAFLNATETEGYRCPLQKNYEDTDELVDYLQEVLVGHFFSNAIIEDTLAEGLTIKKVTPQMRSDGGIWRNFEGGLSHYTIPEPRSETTVKADVEQMGRQVKVTFDMKEEQAWACEHDQVIGDDFRVVIDAELDGFFSVGEGGWQETNEGPATFTFTESNLDDDEEDYSITIEKDSPKIQNVKLTPDYAAEDVVKVYDGKGTNIVVKPIAPTPDDAIIRYSLDEHGTYTDDFALTNVCDKTKVWFEITDKNGDFTTVTNFATVTILPRVVVEQAEDAEKPHDGTPLTQPAHSNVLSRAIAEAEQMYPGQGASAAGFVEGEGFASVPMTADSQQTEVGSHANTIDKNLVTVNEKTDKNNYVFIYLPGTLTVTTGTFTASASPALKVYDGIPTNITVTVTGVPDGVTPVLTYSYSETGGFVPAGEFTGPTNVSESATVYCKVTVPGCGEKVVHADVTILRRYVVEQAGSASKPFDNTPLVCGDHDERPAEELKDALAAYEDLYGEELASSATGFVGADGFASVPMTGDSTITNPGVVSNTIDSAAVTFTPSYDPDNYSVRYLQGELKVTAATFTASAEPVEKFYDSTPTNIIVTVSGIPSGVTPTYEYSYSETEGYVLASEFTGPTNVSESAEVYCRVIIPGTTNTVHATATIRPRIVVSHAKDGEWTFNGEEHKQPDYFEDEDAEAERSKAKWGTDEVLPGSTGFVEGEGYAADLVMTDASRITLPGTKPNAIDQAADKTALKPNTKPENYELYYLDGELKVTAATMGIEAFDAEKFYDAEGTNITWAVTNATGAAITDAVITLREKGTDTWILVADFMLYVDTTNVTVEVKAEKSGFTPVTAEATVLVKPRPVTLVAASDSKVYDGLPLTNWNFTVAADTGEPGYGFVKDEGVDKVTMTPESTVTLPDTVPNVIASEIALPNTKLERNYTVTTEPGTLTVTPAVFTASAMPYDEFYDGQEHTIEVEVQKPEDAGEATITYSYAEGGTYLPIEDFELLKDVTAGGPVTVYAKVKVEGYSTVVVNATVNIKPRIVVVHAKDAFREYGPGETLVELRQPEYYEDAVAEKDRSIEIYGTNPPDAASMGFVMGEGFAEVPMTEDSVVTAPGTRPNLIDAAGVTLQAGTKPDNYRFFYLQGTLEIIQRQEEVRRDPEVEIPEEAKEVVEESDKKIEKALDEMAKADQEASDVSYVKYQLTVTPTNNLSEATRTTPEKAAEDAKEQIELFEETMPDAKVDKVVFVDIVLERTYDKTEAEEAAKGNYNKDNWESLDKAEEHGNRLLEVTIPVDVPEGMELVGVTRSCDSRGTEILLPKDPDDPDAEGFIYDPETKTVTLYAKEFCVFGFMMQEEQKSDPEPPAHGGCGKRITPHSCAEVYDVMMNLKTTGCKCKKMSKKEKVPCGKAVTSMCVSWREVASKKVEGVIYSCACSCSDDVPGSTLIDVNDQACWIAKDSIRLADTIKVTHLYRVGKKTEKVEFAAIFGDLSLAGAGDFDGKSGRVKSVRGQVAGLWRAEPDCSSYGDESCPNYEICDTELPGTDMTIAYGSFIIKYDKKRSAKLAATGVSPIPDKVRRFPVADWYCK